MKKKPSSGPSVFVQHSGQNAILNWCNVPEQDYLLYARSYHTAAKTLAGALEVDPGPSTECDACPVVVMYRQAVELQLKALVLGDGGNFLVSKPDWISIYKSHSLSRLAQFVSQIITTLKWRDAFKCEGIETLADFKAVIEKINSINPGPHASRFPLHISVGAFVKQMDALLDLLDATSDALAAKWAKRSDMGSTRT